MRDARVPDHVLVLHHLALPLAEVHVLHDLGHPAREPGVEEFHHLASPTELALGLQSFVLLYEVLSGGLLLLPDELPVLLDKLV